MLNSSSLDRLLTIAREGSFARAAETLNVSRSALVQQIGQFEEQLGFPIFYRSHKGVRPTETGALFLRETQKLLGSYRTLVKRCAAQYRTGRESIVIGVMPNLRSTVLPEVCKVFKRRFPNVEIRFRDYFPADFFGGFRRGEVDICGENVWLYMLREEPGLAFVKLVDSAHCCAVLPGHPLADCKLVTFEKLRGHRLIMYRRGITRCDDMLRDYILEHEPEIELIDIEVYDSSLITRCELEDAALLMYRTYESNFHGFIIIPTDWPFPLELGLGYHTDCRPVVSKFIEVALEVYRPETGGDKR